MTRARPKRERPAPSPGKSSARKPTAGKKARAESDTPGGERIAKRLARAGLCSRREAERWIAEGRVAVDGTVLTSPAVTVTPAQVVTVDGEAVGEPERARLWRYNKPAGLVCARADKRGRPTVFEKLPAALPRVIAVGALDFSAEGLMLLTNDGELARHLELPATGWTRRYRVRVFGDVDEAKLKALVKGVTVEGVDYGPVEARLDQRKGANAWLTVALREGRKRDVRTLITHLGLKVSRLIRVAFGPFQLGGLEDGMVAEVPAKVIADQVGGKFAKGPQAGAQASANKRGATEGRGGADRRRET